MGCWNATCGLSNLPIFYNDPVIAFVIQREPSKETGSQCYPWESWSPASLIVRGLYDDYGGVTLDPNELETAKASLVDSTRISTRIKFPDSDDYGFGYQPCDPFVVSEDDRGVGLRGQKDGSGYGLWMAHATVFNDLCASVMVEDYRTFKDKAITKRVAEDINAAVAKVIASHSEEFPSYMNNPWRESGDGMNGAAFRCILDELHEASKAEGFEEAYLRALASQWGDLKALYFLMSTLRMALFPLSGAGSQDSNLESFAARNKVFAKQIKLAKARYDE